MSELKKRALENPSDLTIITFNYDLMLERVLDEISQKGHSETFFFPGCYRIEGLTEVQAMAKKEDKFASENFEHKGVALLKLHGSMNWHSRHNSNAPTPKGMFDITRDLHVLNSKMVQHSIVWKRKQRQVYMKPVIVPPVSGKRGMIHQDLLGLWNKAAKALAQADRVVIAGYSCPPLDLEARILLSENLRAKPNKRVYVVDPSPQTATRFIELCGVDFITIYKSIEAWVRDRRP
ncbi:MAG: SIR2 family protein [Nitrospirales bacterium]|nr:SIR2 family protein [Nitrospirales bacterium]